MSLTPLVAPDSDRMSHVAAGVVARSIGAGPAERDRLPARAGAVAARCHDLPDDRVEPYPGVENIALRPTAEAVPC